ncbi:uncharacterized protein LOC129769272 [Toxorhynchites rutilus septentrionalis]|uniref:uncharacterized protein LOC129769272 n=1 Tax=Toxorhynchites rutilus septentrionalis TaxID=329112 RepID=UPI00247B1081|nr:uncharacterized protein LOC129769272 [Toxorhynchites rutilus septentrionalis]
MASWGSAKTASNVAANNARLTRTPSKTGSSGMLTESLTAALGKRKSRFKELTEELNQRINKDEQEEPYQRPLFNIEKIKRIMERIIEKQFAVDEEEMRYIYDPSQNLKMCQNISKQIKDKIKNMNYKRHRIVSLATIVEKQQQGVNYKMRYLLDPNMDNYIRHYHETPYFYLIATVILVHKD